MKNVFAFALVLALVFALGAPAYADGAFKIGGQDYDQFASFIEKINALAAKTETHFTFLVSADESELPKSLDAVSEKV